MAKAEPGITCIAVNPGSLLNAKMIQESYGRQFDEVRKVANILADLAITMKHADKSGQYFDNDRGGYGRALSNAYNAS